MIPDHSQRSHASLPPSSADKWLRCFGWMKAVAAYYEEHGRPPSGAAADEGTRAHERFESLLRSGGVLVNPQDPEMDLLPVSRQTVLPVDLFEEDHDDDLVELLEWVNEQPGDLYVETRVDFGKPFGFHGLTGTSDQIFVEPRRLTVCDLKYGRNPVDVVRNPQLMTYLVGAIELFGPRPQYRLTILQPRAYHPEGSIRSYEVSHAEIEVFKFELEEAIRANFGEGKCTPGSHCRNYCPVLGRCKAVAEEARNRLRRTPIE